MNKIFFQTYGCTSNKADSSAMIGLLQKSGYEITKDAEKADYLVVNTCAVKSNTEEKIIHKLKKYSKQNKKIIIAGCLTKVNPDRIKKTVPNFAGMLDPKSVHKVVDIFNKINQGAQNLIQISEIPEQKPALPKYSFSPVIDIVKISEGCLSNCSFCATKLARGNLFSYRPDVIRDSIKKGIKNGHKEFQLASEDSSAYGKDIGTNLPDLLNSITRIKGDFFARVGMMNPLHFKQVEIKDLIESYKSEKIFKFLHLCVQSGSNSILKKMRRGYKVEDFLSITKKFKKEIPELTLWTDIIVGHPGEKEEDFQLTLDLLNQVKPDFVNVSSFGSRLGTMSAKMKQLPSEIKKKRTKKISDLVGKISLEQNKKWLGWSGKILIDEYHKAKENWIGRNYAYKPVALKGNYKLGQIIDVKIKSVEKSCLLNR